jgi:hypothetical protein
MQKNILILLFSLLFYSGYTQNSKTTAGSETLLGNTYYDLQTQASIPNRIIRYPDGTVSAVWMEALSATAPYADRGTGYTFFNGMSWQQNSAARLETTRSGWPSLAQLKNGTECLVSHHSTQLQALYRTSKGTGPWKEDTVSLKLITPKGIFWPRIAAGGSNGNSLHLIALTQPGYNFAGLKGALTYSRSRNAGASWDILHRIIPGIDSTQYLGFNGENYAIDAKGDTIAIVIGGYDKDVILLKSVDNGTNWVKTIVKAFPIPKYNSATTISDIDKDGIADTIQTNDGAMAVLLDRAGQAHVFYGKWFVFCKSPGTLAGQGLRTLSYTDSLMYWNENVKRTPYAIAWVYDSNKNGKLDLPVVDPGKFPYGVYSVALTSHPSVAIDSIGTIYLAYSSVLESTMAGTKAYRHTYITKSSDGGKTWALNPLDIFSDPYSECVYGSVARKMDGFVHLIYQRDDYPGVSINPNGGASPDPENSNNLNYLIYTKIKSNLTVGLPEYAKNYSAVLIYPNPANQSTTIQFENPGHEKVFVKILNPLGQEIMMSSNEDQIGSIEKITIPLQSVPEGIYFINLHMGAEIFTSKLIVNPY